MAKVLLIYFRHLAELTLALLQRSGSQFKTQQSAWRRRKRRMFKVDWRILDKVDVMEGREGRGGLNE